MVPLFLVDNKIWTTESKLLFLESNILLVIIILLLIPLNEKLVLSNISLLILLTLVIKTDISIINIYLQQLVDLTNTANNILSKINLLLEINNIKILFLDFVLLVKNSKYLITLFVPGFSIFAIILPKLIFLIILDNNIINLLYLDLMIYLIKIISILYLSLSLNLNINIPLVFVFNILL